MEEFTRDHRGNGQLVSHRKRQRPGHEFAELHLGVGSSLGAEGYAAVVAIVSAGSLTCVGIAGSLRKACAERETLTLRRRGAIEAVGRAPPNGHCDVKGSPPTSKTNELNARVGRYSTRG